MSSKEEISVTIENVGTSFTTVAVTGPSKYQILRARATIISGPATQVAMRVRQKDIDYETKLEYGLTVGEIDSIEEQDKIFIFTKERSGAVNGQGTTYIGVQCNTGTTNTIRVALDILIVT